jgi:hypothetical protein
MNSDHNRFTTVRTFVTIGHYMVEWICELFTVFLIVTVYMFVVLLNDHCWLLGVDRRDISGNVITVIGRCDSVVEFTGLTRKGFSYNHIVDVATTEYGVHWTEHCRHYYINWWWRWDSLGLFFQLQNEPLRSGWEYDWSNISQ